MLEVFIVVIKHLKPRMDLRLGRRLKTGVVGFTLIELLAVVLVILLLAGVFLGLAGYARKSTQSQLTRVQLLLLTTALESYKADWGYYPATSPVRISCFITAESSNNASLYNALFRQGKNYLQGFPSGQLRINNFTGLTNIFDVFGTPFNYYNSPTTPYALVNGVNTNANVFNQSASYILGGQINKTSYDLFSYGPDQITFAATNAVYPYWKSYVAGPTVAWTLKSSASDDITNFRR